MRPVGAISWAVETPVIELQAALVKLWGAVASPAGRERAKAALVEAQQVEAPGGCGVSVVSLSAFAVPAQGAGQGVWKP